MKMIHTTCPEHPEATLEGYLLDCEISLGQEHDRPAIIVCPGGGYVYCSPREGEPIALGFAAMGYHAFILRYSTGWDAADFSPLAEISWVIGYLREHAGEWHIAADQILTCGFSAGGHLALAAGVMGEHKPNGMILGYPCASIPNYPGADFMLRMLTGKSEITDEDVAEFDLVKKITKDAPPVFLFATAEDMLTPHGALVIANAYSALGKQYELHIFQHGPHGIGLGTEVSADGSSQILNESFAHWQKLCNLWINQVFVKPQFVDRSTSKMMEHMKRLGITMPGAGAEDGTRFA